MSSSAGKIVSAAINPIAAISGSLGRGLGRAAGVSDPSTAGLLGGAALGGALTSNPTGALIGASIGREQGETIEQQRDAANDENQRQQFNEEVFRLAESLQGRLTGSETSDFDFDSLSFIGSDPRTERLRKLVQAFSTRRNEIQQQTFEPGSSQTRLSLVE